MTNGNGSEPRRIVVVGGGVAAEHCAAELRRREFCGTLTIVSAEQQPPYDRTSLSKEFLTDPHIVAPAGLRSHERYADDGIDLRLGVRATEVRPSSGVLRISTGEALPYDRLIVCTGARAAVPGGLPIRGVHVVREASDALRLREVITKGSRIVVVGGGFVGGEVASSANSLGAQVTVLEALSQPLVQALGAEVGVRIAALHRHAGVDIRTGKSVAVVEHQDGVPIIHLTDGGTMTADAVVVAVGMRPAVGWVRGSGINVDDGIVIDEMCRTNVPGIFAAGDCARWWSRRAGRYMRTEHWATASLHGKAAAAAALGDGQLFDPLPTFWSDQHGVRLQMVGSPHSYDAVEVAEFDLPYRFSARYLREGELVGVFAANAPRAIAMGRREILGNLDGRVAN